MNYDKKIFKLTVLILCAIIIPTCLFSCAKSEPKQDIVSIDYDESFFSDFEIDGDNVYIYCSVKMQNSSNQEQSIKLIADMEKDVQIGLISEHTIYCAEKESGSEVFIIPANSSKAFDIVIKGTHAGSDARESRLLPSFTIQYLNGDVSTNY